MDINVIGDSELGLKAKSTFIKQPMVQPKDYVPSKKQGKHSKILKNLNVHPFPTPDVDGPHSAWSTYTHTQPPPVDEKERNRGREIFEDEIEQIIQTTVPKEIEQKLTLGGSPLPECLIRFLKALPDASFYNGVVIDPDALITMLQRTNLPHYPSEQGRMVVLI
jgi:hypothetical protein